MANQNAFEDMMRMKQDLKQKEDDLSALKGECAKLAKSNDVVARKLKASEDKRQELISSRDLLRGELGALERELEAARRQNESDKKRLDEMARNRDMLTKKVLSSSKETEAQEVLVRMHESTKKTLEAEIAGYKEEAAKQRKIIFQLEKERDKYINDASVIQSKAASAVEEVKLAEAQIFDLKKKLTDAEGKLKQQQSLYEQVRTDRNMYSKNLIEAQDEIAEMKRKLKIMNHQIDQLKEEISTKEVHLQKEHQQYEMLDSQKNKLKAELDRLKMVNATHQKSITEKTNEKEALEKLIKDAEERECIRFRCGRCVVVRVRGNFFVCGFMCAGLFSLNACTHTHMHRHIDKHRQTQTHTHTDTHRQTDTHTDKHRHRHRHRHTHTQTHTDTNIHSPFVAWFVTLCLCGSVQIGAAVPTAHQGCHTDVLQAKASKKAGFGAVSQV